MSFLGMPKNRPTAWLFIIVSICLSTTVRSQGILIESGAHLVTSGAAHIVVHDGKFTNSGNFESGTGTVLISGTVPDADSEIGGSVTTDFYNLTLNKTMNHVQLGTSIQIANNLTLSQGSMNLAGHDITLLGSSGSIIGETETNLIWGASGEIIITRELNAPSAVDPGNLGIEISSVQDLGSTVIKRGHQQISNESGFSINRYYDISPTNNSSLDATLVFHYMESELAEILESDLDIWRNDGSGWEKQYGTLDAAANTVTKSGISSFSTWTLAGNSNPLPIELLSFAGKFLNHSQVELRWSTASEINNDFFTVERASGDLVWKEIIRVDGAGQSKEVLNYQVLDYSFPSGRLYYRLKQTDFDGTFDYSEVITVKDELNDQSLSIYPNPASHRLIIDLTNTNAVEISMFDLQGKMVVTEKFRKSRTHEIDVSELPSGTFLLKIKEPNREQVKLIIVRH